MTTAYDVAPDELVKNVAEKLKKNKAIHLPKWAMDVKTGVSKELPPQDSDWSKYLGAAEYFSAILLSA